MSQKKVSTAGGNKGLKLAFTEGINDLKSEFNQEIRYR